MYFKLLWLNHLLAVESTINVTEYLILVFLQKKGRSFQFTVIWHLWNLWLKLLKYFKEFMSRNKWRFSYFVWTLFLAYKIYKKLTLPIPIISLSHLHGYILLKLIKVLRPSGPSPTILSLTFCHNWCALFDVQLSSETKAASSCLLKPWRSEEIGNFGRNKFDFVSIICETFGWKWCNRHGSVNNLKFGIKSK